MAFGAPTRRSVWPSGGSAHDCLGRDIGAPTRPVFDDEWLAEPIRQPLTDQARENVGRAAGSHADDDAHRPCGIGLCPREA